MDDHNSASQSAQPRSANSCTARLRRPERFQGEMRCESLDERIELDHQARVIWDYVEQLDVSGLLASIKSIKGHAGRDANDPRIYMALWLYASVEGVGSARELDRLCKEHRAYEWIRGNVGVNYHGLADFRVKHAEWLDRTFAESLAVLSKEGLIDINTVAQDGVRIRASAGSDTFRREATLKEHLVQAEQHLKNLKAEIELNPEQLSQRRKAAKERAANDKIERLKAALDNVREIAESREARKKGDGEAARASSTDPEARRMKMPDGGTRPAYNVQFATDVKSNLIVGVNTSNAGNDANELEPMIEQIQQNLGKTPEQSLVDGGYSTVANADYAKANDIELFTVLRNERKQLEEGKDPYAHKRHDTEGMKDLRDRMKNPESKEIYKLRGQSAEWTNAQARNHGLYQFRVRGKEKVQAVLLIFALAHNLLRANKLRATADEAVAEAAKQSAKGTNAATDE